MKPGPKPKTPTCHPERKHFGRDFCQPCYMRDLRDRRKAAGYPEWVRGRMTYAYYLKKLKRRQETNRPEQRKIVNARYRQKQRELYGGLIDSNPVARLRWAMAKNGIIAPGAI